MYWSSFVWFHGPLQPDAPFELDIELLEVISPAEKWPFLFVADMEHWSTYGVCQISEEWIT